MDPSSISVEADKRLKPILGSYPCQQINSPCPPQLPVDRDSCRDDCLVLLCQPTHLCIAEVTWSKRLDPT